LGKLSAATNHVEEIDVPSGYLTAGYNVYVRISQNGKVSPYMGLSARPFGPGGSLIEVPWGFTPTVITEDLTAAITVPEAGQTPAGFNNSAVSQYTGTIEWSNALYDDGVVSQFGYDQIYKARVHLTRVNGSYTFTGVESLHDYIDGTYLPVVRPWGYLTPSSIEITLDIVFPPTSTGLATIDYTHLDPYIIPPVVNGPKTLTIDNNQYSGTVAWSSVTNPGWAPSASFVVGHTYRADVSLTAKTVNSITGWTFTGSNAFSHEDAEPITNISIASKTATMSINFVCTNSGPIPIAEEINLAQYLAPPQAYKDFKTGWSDSGIYKDRDENKWFNGTTETFPISEGNVCVFELVGIDPYTFAGAQVTFVYRVESEGYYQDVEIDRFGYSPEGISVRGLVRFTAVYMGNPTAGDYWSPTYDY
jgi:hypothetical protein